MSADIWLYEGPIVFDREAVRSWLRRAELDLCQPPFLRLDNATASFNDFDNEGNPVTVSVTIRRGWDRR